MIYDLKDADFIILNQIKSKTIIKDNVKIGSNSVLVAPVKLGENSSIGAGSIISKDIEANALGLTRAPLKIFKDWFEKMKK